MMGSIRASYLLLPFLVFYGVSCDNFVPNADSPPSPDPRHALVEAWYNESISQLQSARYGKWENAEILAAMVNKYPPDWTQSFSMPLGEGITRVITILGAEQSATTHSHAALAAIRTISVDVNPDNEVSGSRLLEFVSPDSLVRDDFATYVRQWGNRDFGDLRMMVSEYDIGYASKVCEIWTPGEGFQSVDLKLEEVSGSGKAAGGEMFCYISDIEKAWVCVGEPAVGDPEDYDGEEHCSLDSITVHITCVSFDEMGGGGGDGGNGGGGGDNGDGDDDSEEEGAEEECSCADEIPCTIAVEYDSLGVLHHMSCDLLTTSGAADTRRSVAQLPGRRDPRAYAGLGRHDRRGPGVCRVGLVADRLPRNGYLPGGAGL